MNRYAQPVLITLAVLVLTATGSHLVVHWLGVRTSSVSHRTAGVQWDKEPLAYLAGSSLLGDALDIDKVCSTLEQGLQTWFVAGGSPSEWVEFQPRAADANLTIIGISAYDLNEHFFCDVQANIVPLSNAIRDLSQSRSDWAFSKRVLSQYPQKYLRIAFPTIGRSGGVFGGAKERLEKLIRPKANIESDAGPRVPTWGGSEVDPTRLETISDWSSGYLLRQLGKQRSACKGMHSFDGPKRIALLRMLEKAQTQGHVVVLVLPVSPFYQEEFLDVQTAQQFEAALNEFQSKYPKAYWVRLDQLAELNSNDLFWDVVHMNNFGKQIATEAFLKQIEESFTTP